MSSDGFGVVLARGGEMVIEILVWEYLERRELPLIARNLGLPRE